MNKQRLCALAILSTVLFVAASAESNEEVAATFPKDFVWGVANAPAQAEDDLEDGWVDFAERGFVKAWKNQNRPKDRVMFWSKPELEINDAADGGSNLFRMGVDWTRLVPNAPEEGGHRGVQNTAALARYKETVKKIRAKGMKVMISLFHHSIPMWAASIGGWDHDDTILNFNAFAKDVVAALGDDVDYWITFNEPTVFAMFVHCSGMWPPGRNVNPVESLYCITPVIGTLSHVMNRMTKSHKEVFGMIKTKNPSARVGIAHNVGVYEGFTFIDSISAQAMERTTLFPFMDTLVGSMDFIGLNYYGRELTKGISVAVDDKYEYSESGRGVWPNGLHDLLKKFHERYNVQKQLNLPLMITENGISDKTDILRPSYLVEHLLAVRAAMDDGVPVEGYIHWGTSDNWEWADGYCPGFGLVGVDRDTMKRTRRPSFFLYKQIQESGVITQAQRDESWKKVRDAVAKGATRPFCRAPDGKSSLDEPVQRPIIDQDWRFNKAKEARMLRERTIV